MYIKTSFLSRPDLNMNILDTAYYSVSQQHSLALEILTKLEHSLALEILTK